MIAIVLGVVISAIVAIQPFVTYVKYYRDLQKDFAFVSDPRISWLGECSSKEYAIDAYALKAEVEKNRTNALIISIFFGLWIGLATMLPILLIFVALMGKLCGSGDAGQNCREAGKELKHFLKSYKEFN